jgi:hypothetical protein
MRYDFLCPIPYISLPISLIPLIHSTSRILLGAVAFDPAHVHRLLQSIHSGETPPEDRGGQDVHATYGKTEAERKRVKKTKGCQHIQKQSLDIKLVKLISRIVVMITFVGRRDRRKRQHGAVHTTSARIIVEKSHRASQPCLVIIIAILPYSLLG